MARRVPPSQNQGLGPLGIAEYGLVLILIVVVLVALIGRTGVFGPEIQEYANLISGLKTLLTPFK